MKITFSSMCLSPTLLPMICRWIGGGFTLTVSLAMPSWIGAISTSQRAVMPCGCGVKAGMVRVWVASKTVRSHCYTRAICEHFRDKGLLIKCSWIHLFTFTLLTLRDLSSVLMYCCQHFIGFLLHKMVCEKCLFFKCHSFFYHANYCCLSSAGVVHSVSGWMRGVQLKLRSVENTCHTWAP